MTLLVERITKRYPSGRGVADVSLDARRGEVIAVIGPSGCGKTTLLRVVAGLARPDSGRVLIGGRDVTTLPPEGRRVGLVFQSYALFPHLSVFDNVAYGLRAKGMPRAAIPPAVDRILGLVDLAGRVGRVDELSGGEQQRVAVARAVVTEPEVLLLDEPLSNLDPNLRRRMRASLREILGKLSIPSLHVTHDQEEALAIADRIAVLDSGRLAQLGTPDDVYRRPNDAFVAWFVGHANVVPARVERTSDGTVETVAWTGVPIAASAAGRLLPGQAVELAIRPESVGIVTPGPSARGFDARVQVRSFLGPLVELRCEVGGAPFVARLPSHGPAATVAAGDVVRFHVDPGEIHVMTPRGGPS